MKSVVFHIWPKNSPIILSTFDRILVTKIFQKSPIWSHWLPTSRYNFPPKRCRRHVRRKGQNFIFKLFCFICRRHLPLISPALGRRVKTSFENFSNERAHLALVKKKNKKRVHHHLDKKIVLCLCYDFWTTDYLSKRVEIYCDVFGHFYPKCILL